MYKETWALFNGPEGVQSQVMRNVLIESHILHLRNLIHFFMRSQSHYTDDILVSNVLVNADGYYLGDENELTKMLNKSAQHLTTYRAEMLDKTVLLNMIKDIYPVICERIDRFEKDINNPDRLQETYRNDYEEYIKERKVLRIVI